MVTNDIKMGSIPTGIWPTTFQNKKLPYLKLRLGTYEGLNRELARGLEYIWTVIPLPRLFPYSDLPSN